MNHNRLISLNLFFGQTLRLRQSESPEEQVVSDVLLDLTGRATAAVRMSIAAKPETQAALMRRSRATVMMYIRYTLSLRQVKDLLFERGIDIYSSGGSMDPADAYTAFRGRLPSPDALLEMERLDGG